MEKVIDQCDYLVTFSREEKQKPKDEKKNCKRWNDDNVLDENSRGVTVNHKVLITKCIWLCYGYYCI